MSRLTRYEPINALSDIDKLIKQAFYPSSDSSNADTTQWVPAVDIHEGGEQFEISVDLPGIDKKDIHISMENNILVIQGERSDEIKEEKKNYYRIERVSGKFYRRFTLPETADAEKVKANMDRGVLKIKIPKKETTKARKIEIEAK